MVPEVLAAPPIVQEHGDLVEETVAGLGIGQRSATSAPPPDLAEGSLDRVGGAQVLSALGRSVPRADLLNRRGRGSRLPLARALPAMGGGTDAKRPLPSRETSVFERHSNSTMRGTASLSDMLPIECFSS